MHVQPVLATGRAPRRPIAVGITDPPIVRGPVDHVFGDERAAFLSGRPESNEACFWIRERESILAHERRSGVVVDLKCTHLLLCGDTSVVTASIVL
jgi:hypothetical protein